MKKLYHQRLDGIEAGLNAIEKATKRAVALSEANIGVVHTGRQNRVLFVFAKMIAHNMSSIGIIRTAIFAEKGASLLDHFSVAALGRISIDAAIMTLYLSEPSLTLAEWNLRRHLLYLHNDTNRKRFLDAMVKAEGVTSTDHLEGYAEAKAARHAAIETYGKEAGLSQDKVEKLLKGEVFVSGVRGAVREAGLNLEAWEAHNAYFSPYIHAHPVSFMRADQHAIAFDEPSPYQKYLCNYVTGVVAGYTEAVNNRIEAFCRDIADDPLGHVE